MPHDEPRFYSAYGITFASSLKLPEFGPPAPPTADPDVIICHHHLAYESQTQINSTSDHISEFEIDGVGIFHVTTSRIDIYCVSQYIAERLKLYLLGSAIGILLMRRKNLVLHGNSIRLGRFALVCVGDSGAGKSTLAAAFLARGFDVLADDVVPIDESCKTVAGIPRIKLWKDAAEKLNIDVSSYQRILPGVDKFSVPIKRRSSTRVPVRWIYSISLGDTDQIMFEPIKGAECLQALHRNTYRGQFLKTSEMLASHLRICSSLSSVAKISTLTRPAVGTDVRTLVDKILTDAVNYQGSDGDLALNSDASPP